MTRYLSLAEVLKLHGLIIAESSGSAGLRDLGMLESALGQPRQTFGGEDLYPSLPSKAAALGFSLIMNHPFIDGNKRIGHASQKAFTHNLEKLLGLAGLEPDLKKDMRANPTFEVNWATVKDWSESKRYELGITTAEAKDLYSACTARRHGVLTWIRKRW